MISKRQISLTLASLDRQYLHAKSNKQARFAAKLALIELCGWIEVSIDDVLVRASVRMLRPGHRRDFEHKLSRTNGFHYENHVRPLLLLLMGEVSTLKVEKRVPAVVLQNFKSSLGHLKPQRDSAAHTFITPTVTLNAPSALIAHFTNIFDGLNEFDKALRRIKVKTQF